MNDTIVNGIFTLVGVALGSGFSLLGTYIATRNQTRKEVLNGLADQVLGYWYLEDKLAEKIYELEQSRKPKTIKEDFRKLVENEIGIYPNMTESRVNRVRAKI